MTARRDVPDRERTLDLLLQVNRLKTTPRTGWAQRGVPNYESVADHSHGVAFAALLLCDLVPEPVSRDRVLAMAVLHDFPEAVTGDLSLGASRLLPPGAKAQAESAAVDELLDGLPFASAWRELVAEFEAQDTLEARIVRDADRVDLLVQALAYERAHGTVDLEEFWRFAPPESFALPQSRELIEALRARRGGAR